MYEFATLEVRQESRGKAFIIKFTKPFTKRGKNLLRDWLRHEIGNEDHPAEIRWLTDARLRIVPRYCAGVDHVLSIESSTRQAVATYNTVARAQLEIIQVSRPARIA